MNSLHISTINHSINNKPNSDEVRNQSYIFLRNNDQCVLFGQILLRSWCLMKGFPLFLCCHRLPRIDTCPFFPKIILIFILVHVLLSYSFDFSRHFHFFDGRHDAWSTNIPPQKEREIHSKIFPFALQCFTP